MIGAIIGDVVGSRFEFANHRSKEFLLFHDRCEFTDDTVLTLAVAKIMAKQKNEDVSLIREALVEEFHRLGRKYPHCGFGGKFHWWLITKNKKPYNSFGNGSAMRVSPVAWVAESLEECERLATISAEVTHNHPEGIKGAVATAGCIYLARTGHSMEEIRAYAEQFYTLDFTLDEIRDAYEFDETCQGSVPQALEAFFEAKDFEDAIRNAVSVGGDSDTIAAITGSVAEGFFGIPDGMQSVALSYLDEELQDIAEEFLKQKKEG